MLLPQYPVYGIVLGGLVGILSLDPATQRAELRAGGNRQALYAFAVSLVASAAVMAQNYCFTSTAEQLCARLRVATFAAILRQDVSFFDKTANSTGHLTSTVSSISQGINGLFGVTGALMIQNCCESTCAELGCAALTLGSPSFAVTLLVGSIIALCYSWRIALVAIACMPIPILVSAAPRL